MESPAIVLDAVLSPDGSAVADCSLASLRRRAWAKSRESTWQETQKTLTSRPPQEPPPDCTESNGEPKKTSEEPGLSPNKITSWLDQCRTPLAVSLDDQSIPLGKGAPRNGCSFEDDLSLGAEADHLQSSSKTTGSCGSLAADQKRSQYKEKGRSMNSTGSGKSSTVSSVSELLDLYEEDPEEILLNLGFGRDEPDMSSKIPSRFFNSSSAARGIDIKVYLGAQLQRMEVENPNYALTSRFRQIEVLTTVANQFIQLYGHVSGQPVQSVCSFSGSRDQGGGEVTKDQSPPSIFQRRTSAQNVADRLKKSLSKHNLLMASHSPPSRPDDKTPPTLANGHSRQLHDGHSEQDGDEQTAEKHIRKKDSCSLATVTEETSGSGDVEVEQHTHTGQNGPGGEPDFTDTGSTNQSTNEPQASGAEEKSITSNPDKALPNKAPPTQGVAPLSSPLLAQLRTENADSFDMEEIQSNEDEALLSRTSRSSDLLRAVSQQSDSSGFAEEMLSVDASNLKVQESSDSCDSETTVTSHPSHDVATPVALDQPAFDLPDTRVEKSEPTSGATAAAVSNRSSQEQEKNEKCDGNSELVPQYKAHQLPKNIPLKDVRQGGSGPESQENHEQEQTQPLQDDDQRELLSSDPPPLNQLSCNPPCLDLPSLDPPPLNCLPLDPQSSDPLSSNLPSHSPSLDPPPSHHPLSVQAPSPPDHPFNLPTPDSPVLSALSRVKQRLGDAGPRPSRRHHRSGLPLQRSSSLPSSLLSPTRVVSSVKVQLGGGRAFCSQPCYAFRFIQDPNANLETADVPSCISTLVIESTSESDHKYAALPKATPRPLIRSSHSLRSASPPTNWPWITQSVPNLSSKREQFGHDQQGGTPNPGPDIFLSPSPSPRPESPMSTPPVNPSLLYPSFLHPYASLPNLHHHHSNHFPFHQPPMGTPPHYSSLWNLPLGIPPMPHYPAGNYHMAYHSIPHSPPYLGYSGYELSPLPPLAPDHIIHRGGAPPGPGLHPDLGQGHTPHRGLANSSHLGHNLGQSPHPRFGNSSHPGHSLGLHPVVSQGHTSYNGVGNSPHLGHSLGHSPYLGVNPHQSTYTGHNLPHNPHPGFGLLHNPQPSHSLVSSHNPHLGLSPGSCQVLSGTEMQLRRVLHEIRGTVHSLNQQRVETSEIFLEASCQQALETLQQKRRSLGLFRAQMMDLELSIVRQQALVYKHLSPADRLEMEHLISLRSAVREELLELEQQLEDKLMDLTQHAAPGKGVSTDNVSTNSTLRAMEPVSDLLREQFLLQSELNYDDHAASSAPSSVSSFRPRTPTPGVSGDPQKPAVYRAFINITPVPPPRTDRLQYQREEEELGAGEKDEALEEAGAERLCEDNLHHIITETRESVTQEVRQEIFNELMVATGASCLLTRPADP